MTKSYGFFILRHVDSPETNVYWQECYDCIRKFYPDLTIVIIDDNSNYEYITTKPLHNTFCIQSEYPGRGEVLPYYYYLLYKKFDVAIILHDSVFINRPIDFQVDTYKIIWDFNHICDQVEDEELLIKSLSNHEELLAFHKKREYWKGCFGGMTIISYDYLKVLHDKYGIHNLLGSIRTRFNRMSFERVLGCMLKENHETTVLLGHIHGYMPWGTDYQYYLTNKGVSNLPLLKVWTGR